MFSHDNHNPMPTKAIPIENREIEATFAGTCR